MKSIGTYTEAFFIPQKFNVCKTCIKIPQGLIQGRSNYVFKN